MILKFAKFHKYTNFEVRFFSWSDLIIFKSKVERTWKVLKFLSTCVFTFELFNIFIGSTSLRNRPTHGERVSHAHVSFNPRIDRIRSGNVQIFLKNLFYTVSNLFPFFQLISAFPLEYFRSSL